MDDDVRLCNLSGCDVRIAPVDGRPQRRYCTAGHRAAARKARRATRERGPAEPCSRTVLPGRDGLAESLPWLPEPEVRDRKPGTSTATARPDTAAADHASVRPRRRRTLAVLGVASVLAGGYAASASRTEPPSPVPVQAAPAGESPDAWAQRATVALASVDRQLDTLTQAEEQWKRQVGSGPTGRPAPVGALEERRSVLQRQRATLRSQLEAYRSLRMTQQSLAVSERHLQAVEKALADAAPGRRRSAEQAAALAALDEQRDLRLRHREAQRTELNSLQEGVATAVRTPLPDDEVATAEISRKLRDTSRTDGRAPKPRDADDRRPPEVVAGRQLEDGKPREEAGVGGPPDPRGPRGEGEERRAAKEARRAEVERKAAAEHSARLDAGASREKPTEADSPEEARPTGKPSVDDLHEADEPGDVGVHEKTGERLEKAGHRKKEDANTDEAGRTGSRKPDRSDEADDDRIEERNAARAAEQAESGAWHRYGPGRTRAQRQPTDEDRPSDRKDSSREEHSSEEKQSADEEDEPRERSSDRERSSRTRHSSDTERSSSHEDRTADEERWKKSRG